MASTALVVPLIGVMASIINNDHRRAVEASKSMLSFAIHAGAGLLKVKKMLPHGEFGAWCRENLEFSYDRAMRYMRAAKLGVDPNYGGTLEAALDAIAVKTPEQQPGGIQPLDTSTADRIIKLSRMANSGNENEAAVAQEMIDRLGKKFGMTGEEAETAAKKLCPEPPTHEELVKRAGEFNAKLAERLSAIEAEVRLTIEKEGLESAIKSLSEVIYVLKYRKEFKHV